MVNARVRNRRPRTKKESDLRLQEVNPSFYKNQKENSEEEEGGPLMTGKVSEHQETIGLTLMGIYDRTASSLGGQKG